MFSNKNPITKIRTFKPGDVVIIVSTGKQVTIIAKGDGTVVGIDDGTLKSTVSGEIAARRA